ncbi:extracellular solute-binding protein [Jiangella alba]|uniref:ABC-type glycerol-3-phosphate transport system, substrate-binding protein n=1 Tax=Jiangella alba TaxID=561176 RepID=A0A1H5MZL9_9ACTN|nr:extracellular solute-binding protein [Jiangella alba]SEE93848.1 ABC-type glycerol-3-phosphate transport system, substrate-binding protein [Jiangella alba]
MRTATKRSSTLAVLLALTLGVAACGGDGQDDPTRPAADESVDLDADVTITVGDLPPASEPEEREFFEGQVEAFTAANPNITVEASEELWDVQTFQAKVAAGDLPDVLAVPFTEANSLAERGQIAELSQAMDLAGLTADLDPNLVELVSSDDGGVYAVPTAAQALGLIYNRDLFVQAGLDPDDPPRTWDDVRVAARQITEATGATGFATMTTEGQGGWMLAAGVYSFGGTIENEDGTEATFDDQPATDYLELLHAMRWEDQSMGSNFLYNAAGLVEDFAAGRVGMFIGFSGLYRPAVIRNEMPAESFGMGPMPVGGHADPTALTGGVIQVVSPDATPEERVAAVKWIDFFYLGQFTDETVAVTQAEAGAAAGQAVTVPERPAVSQDAYDQYFEWIAPYLNVPIANFDTYIQAFGEQTLQPEPAVKAQEVYSQLDVVVQQVLTEESADVGTVLGEAATAVDRLLGR